MKLILSRKGFDSAYGGSPSPILPSGEMVSFPIPEHGQRSYDMIRATPEYTMRELLEQLGAYRPGKHSGAHLDPDLVPEAVPRRPGWRPCFGQCAQAQTHLSNQGVGPGDVFLFFGSFRKTLKSLDSRLHFDPDSPVRHVLFGYLEIAQVIKIGLDDGPSWASDHPHYVNRARRSNTLYLSSPRLSWDSSVPGGGTFRFAPELVLSKDGATRRVWTLPSFFHPSMTPTILSRHSESNFAIDEGLVELTTVSPGQEYVIDVSPDIVAWTKRMIAAGRSM